MQVTSPIEYTRKVVSGGKKSFGLSQLHGEGGPRQLFVRKESPWDTYRRTLRCHLASEVSIAARRSRPAQMVATREYTDKNVARMLRMYDNRDHENILAARECFVDGESMYILVNDLPLTLEQLVGCRSLFPTEAELTCMLCFTFQLFESLPNLDSG